MGSKAGILIVDDEQSVRALCREFLQSMGYFVDEAMNGTEAMEKLSLRSYSLILSDIMMPDINGLELASIIRKRYPDTFVILVTGYGTMDLAKEAIQRGAFDFVTKPFKMSELNRMVDRALEVRRKRLSVLPSPELKDLYNLTVNMNVSDQTMDTYLDNLVGSLRKTFRGDAARAYLTEKPGGTRLSRKSGSGDEGHMAEDVWERASLRGLSEEGGYLESSDAPLYIPEECPVSSLMAVPIPSSEGNLGIFLVTRSSVPAPFTSRDLKLMGLFAAQAGNQLMNIRMASNLRAQADNLEKVNILAGEFSSSLVTEKVLSSISRGLRSILEYDMFGVYLRGKDMIPFSYMLVRSDMPGDALSRDVRKFLLKSQDKHDTDLFIDGGIRDSFASPLAVDWSSEPLVEVLDMGDFGSLKGMIVLASWHPSSNAIRGSTHIPILLRHAAAALSNAYLFETSERNYIQTISALAGAVDAKDRYTHNHSRNVAAYSTAIAAHMNLSSRRIALLNSAALLHDIGKIGIPEEILNKEGPLSSEEYAIIKSHPETGYNILRPVTAFGSFIDAVRYHHERYDGSGYPSGLASTDIPLPARILAVADGFDAMTSDRVYRESQGLDYAISEMIKNSGTQFDPEIGDLFLSILEHTTPEDIINEYLLMGSYQLTVSEA